MRGPTLSRIRRTRETVDRTVAAPALVTPLFAGRKVRFPIPTQRDRAMVMRFLKELIESGAFKPLIDRRYPLDEIVEAYRYVETGQKLGNVVIIVPALR